MKKVNLLGINIDDCTLNELLESVSGFIDGGERRSIMYANIHVINTAICNKGLAAYLSKADIIYCDGDGVRLGAKILGSYLPERMTGADWIYELCRLADTKSYSIYLLGGSQGVAEAVCRILSEKYKGLNIAGTHHGYFDFKGDDNSKLIREINKLSPDILLVGFGTPLQEEWIYANRDSLNIPVVWSVGALMDFVSGTAKRAPQFMLNNHLEWLFRLYQEPKRMWRRYVMGNILFMGRIIMARIKKVYIRS